MTPVMVPPPPQDSLLQCVTRKVPVLLAQGRARLLVIDSVAAPFRCEFPGPDAVPRAGLLQALGAALRRLSHTFESPVLCINQVSPGQGGGSTEAKLTLGPCR